MKLNWIVSSRPWAASAVIGGALVVSLFVAQVSAQNTGPGNGNVLVQSSGASITQDGDWIRWDYPNSLDATSRQVTIYQGKKNSQGGCSYSGEDTVEYQSTRRLVTVERQIAEQPGLCLMMTESAEYQISQALEDGLLEPSDLASPTGPGNIGNDDRSGSTLILESHYTYNGSIKSYYEDPPQLDVNSIHTKLSWTKNSRCITAAHGSSSPSWIEESGWQRIKYTYTEEAPTCYEAWRSAFGQFKNPYFCVTIDTWTELTAQYRAWNNGRSGTATWRSDKWGGCTFLLSFQKNIVHPW